MGVWPRRSARSLLLLLLITPKHRLARERAIEHLWPDLAADQVRNTWYQALSTLRRILEPSLPRQRASAFLHVDATTIALNVHPQTWIDVDQFEEALRRASQGTLGEQRVGLRSALALYEGDLLSDESTVDWALARREELRLTWQHAVLRLADLDLRAGEPLATIAALQAVLAGERTAEDVQRALIRAFLAAGERDKALRQYEHCRRALRAELGIEPDDLTDELLVAHGVGARREQSPSLPAADTVPRRRPPNPATPLVGRDAEIATVEDVLWRAEVRLVTLIGPGGVGKTRLAIEVARRADQEDANVIFVPLAGLRSPDLVLLTVAEALGVRNEVEGSLLSAVVRRIGQAELLLVLDNFEHVAAAATVVARLLAACPSLTVLVTSRAPLHLGGEHMVAVPPLALPGAQRPSVAALARSDAVTLFVQRASAARADFALTEQNALTVARLCAQLDGLPLAIELAAARVRVLSPPAILARLDQRLDLLAGGPRDAPVRLRTMRHAIGWSYELLTPQEQTLFRRLAVFTGGFMLEAAAAVGGAGGTASAQGVLELISSLVDKSLLRPAEGTDVEPRFGMLETIREYGVEQLAAHGERDDAQRRHAAFFLSFAEAAERKLRSRDQVTQLALLEAEHDNLRAALAWSLEAPERADIALRLVAALHWFWYLRDHYSEGRRRLEEVLALPATAERTPARVKALAGAGLLAIHPFRDYTAARAWLEQSITLARALGDTVGLAYALHVLGWAELLQADHGELRPAIEESVALFRKAGDRWGLATALCTLGMAIIVTQEPSAATAVLAEGLALSRELGDTWGLARALHYSGEVARFRGDDERARALYEESLALYHQLEHRGAAAIVLHNLGYVAQHQGSPQRALVCFAEALAEHITHGDRQNIGHCLGGIAGMAALLGQPEQAARLFGAADMLFLRIGTSIWPVDKVEYDSNLEAVRARLGENAFAAAVAAGRALPLEQAIAEARAVAEMVGSEALSPTETDTASAGPSVATAEPSLSVAPAKSNVIPLRRKSRPPRRA
jgi:predicted ATPase/DNA-binding SARP family transcriptional activator